MADFVAAESNNAKGGTLHADASSADCVVKSGTLFHPRPGLWGVGGKSEIRNPKSEIIMVRAGGNSEFRTPNSEFMAALRNSYHT